MATVYHRARLAILQVEVINKFTHYFDHEEQPNNHDDQIFTFQEYTRLYMIIYESCQGRQHDNFQHPYNAYREIFEEYITSMVLTSLRGKDNESLLRELLRRWKNHKIMTKWLSVFFHYLSRNYIPHKRLPSLVETSYSTFYDLVHGELGDAITTLIDREREGVKINQALVREVLNIYEELVDAVLENIEKYIDKDIVMKQDDFEFHSKNALALRATKYFENIEDAIVKATAKFYSKKGLQWIATKSFADYMLKVEECLDGEKKRVSDYLKFRNKHKLLEVLQHELIDVHATRIVEKNFLNDAAA